MFNYENVNVEGHIYWKTYAKLFNGKSSGGIIELQLKEKGTQGTRIPIALKAMSFF